MARLGGEFELSLAQFSAPVVGLPKFAASRKHACWTDTGRSALWLAADAAKKKLGRAEAWLPDYACESVFEPFAALGYKIRLYSVGADLATPSGLPEKLNGCVFLFIHYFGKRNVAAENYVARRRSAGDDFVAVEDCVQAALTAGVGAVGDYAVCSWRKLLPAPDGAVLACDAPIDHALAAPDEGFVARRALGKFLRGAGGADADFLRLFEDSEARLRADAPREISWLSRRLLERCAAAAASARRRENWTTLSRALAGVFPAGAGPLFGSLADGEVPLGLPVRVPGGRRDALRAALAQKGMYCPVHWDAPKGAGPDAAALSREELTLPVDPRASAADMAALADEIRSFFGGAH